VRDLPRRTMFSSRELLQDRWDVEDGVWWGVCRVTLLLRIARQGCCCCMMPEPVDCRARG